MEKLSVVVPMYNEEEAIPLFYEEINKVSHEINELEFELIFVDDGSKDKTLSIIKTLAYNDSRIKYISFSRNFGKEAAMYAGLKKASGDLITIMDADLQDPPKLLKEMYLSIKEEGYDQIGTKRKTRTGEPKIRSFFARMFYHIINKMNGKIEIVDGARDYRLMKRCVVDSILSLGEKERFSKGIFSFVGYKTKWIEYDNINRVAGTTKWSFIKLFEYAISFTTIPLRLPIYFGIISFIISIIMFIMILINGMLLTDLFKITALLLLMFGILFIFVGIMGLYIAKNYLETKNRPMYFIKEEN